MIGNLSKKKLLDLGVPLVFANHVLPKLPTKTTSSLLDKFERKINGKGAVRAGKGFTLFISNENTNDITKIVESLEKTGLLIDGATEAVRHEIKKQEGVFLGVPIASMAASLITYTVSSLTQPISSSFINAITGKGQEGRFLPLLALPLMIKVLGKGVKKAGRGYNNMNHKDTNF